MRNVRNKGFTLIELVIVIVILGILAAFAIPKFIDMSVKAEDATCKANLAHLRSGIAINRANSIVQKSPSWPASLTDVLEAGTSVPTCPISGESYTYDSTTGEAKCPNARHSAYSE